MTHSLGLEALVEVHTDTEMALAVAARGQGDRHQIFRNLHTFEMFPDRALDLAPLAPPGVTLVMTSAGRHRSSAVGRTRRAIDACAHRPLPSRISLAFRPPAAASCSAALSDFVNPAGVLHAVSDGRLSFHRGCGLTAQAEPPGAVVAFPRPSPRSPARA